MYVAKGEFRCPACGAPCQPMRANYHVDNAPIRDATQIVGYTQGRAEGQFEFACRLGCRIEITTGFEPFMEAVHRSVDSRYRGRRMNYIPYDDPYQDVPPKPKPKVDEPFPEWPEPEEREP